MSPTLIETERLVLRPPEDEDIDPWTAMLADRETGRYLGPPIDSCEAVTAHIRTVQDRHSSDGFGVLAVVRRSDGRVIGRSGCLGMRHEQDIRTGSGFAAQLWIAIRAPEHTARH